MKKLVLFAALLVSTSVISTASQAYTCAWRGNHRVCWHDNTTVYHVYPTARSTTYVVYDRAATPCYWVNGRRFCR